LDSIIREKELQLVDKFRLKILQLFDMMVVRYGVMIIGQTGSGKTTCYNLLRESLIKIAKEGTDDERFR